MIRLPSAASVARRALRALPALAIVGTAIALAPRAGHAGEEDAAVASGTVFVVKAGRTPLRAAPALGAPAKGAVLFGQKLLLEKKTNGGTAWLLVKVPGDPAEGWLPASATVDKRPGIRAEPVPGAREQIRAAEGSTASAIRGLDGRTAAYAKAKQLPPEVFDQLSRQESFGEQLFDDHHVTDKKGGWHYHDATAPGRQAAARKFAAGEGLKAPPAP